MAPLNPIWPWAERDVEEDLSIVAKYYFICEGSKTEKWYFEALFAYLNKLPQPVLIQPVYVERDGNDETISHPKRLAEYAAEIRADKDGKFDFDPAIDRTVVVFDADIYKTEPDEYKALLEDLLPDNIVCVTSPSIELFLLLHEENAYQAYVEPYVPELLENAKVTKNRRFADKHFSEQFDINPKTNSSVGDLARNVEIAIEEEKHLNNDITKACETLTSNIGQVIEQIMNLPTANPPSLHPHGKTPA